MSSAAVVIGALRVKLINIKEDSSQKGLNYRKVGKRDEAYTEDSKIAYIVWYILLCNGQNKI